MSFGLTRYGLARSLSTVGRTGHLTAPFYLAGAKVWEFIRGSQPNRGDLTVGEIIESRREWLQWAVVASERVHLQEQSGGCCLLPRSGTRCTAPCR
jgi:hypothetical protein